MKHISKHDFDHVHWHKLGFNYFGKPSMYVNVYTVDGLLLDTGFSNMRKPFIKSIESLAVSRIILTHHHEDHSGNLEAIKTAKKVKAYGHPKTNELISKVFPISFARHLSWGKIQASSCLPLDLTKPIETDQYKFDVHHIPGHSEDQIALHEKSKGWLFSADLYLTTYPKIFMYNENIMEMIASLEKMIALDFDVLFCCHRPRLENGKSFLIQKKTYLEEFYEKVIHEYQKGNNAKQCMKNLGLKEMKLINLMSQKELGVENMVKSCIRAFESNY